MAGNKTSENMESWQGKRLHEAAEASGLSSLEIGKRMGRSGASIRYWWHGERRIGLEDLKTYAAITNYPLDYFLHKERRLPEDQQLRSKIDTLVDELRKFTGAPEGYKFVRTSNGNAVCVPAHSHPKQEDIDLIDKLLVRSM